MKKISCFILVALTYLLIASCTDDAIDKVKDNSPIGQKEDLSVKDATFTLKKEFANALGVYNNRKVYQIIIEK